MTSGEYLFTTLISSLYTSAWWSLVLFPEDKMSEFWVVFRIGFLGISTIFILWFVIEKLVKEGRSK